MLLADADIARKRVRRASPRPSAHEGAQGGRRPASDRVQPVDW